MTFGSGRLVDVREGPNIRLSFDGGRVFYESPTLDSTLSARLRRSRARRFSMTIAMPATFPGEAFWGPLRRHARQPCSGLHVDIYYLGPFVRMRRLIPASLTRSGRHRYAHLGSSSGLDYDIEGIFQFGDFGGRHIRAWSVAFQTTGLYHC